ncbi:hypothetical protein PCANC_12026 [Puccinia coronata f. sp. avenae]|uniref:Uncharacterized protein n=1 Tax=Puccinia coronata f. sp. avenae TaxID=200324 RepID=A0A2N5UUS4_9BASI|nr:hypothetical protein PCANC_12026 [Puccinia coronata f. sp. avenae]
MLYKIYHLQAPEFSADEYRTYYLAHQWKLRSDGQMSWDSDCHNCPANELDLEYILSGPDRSKVAAALGISDNLLDSFLKLQEDVLFPSLAELHLEYILSCPDRANVAAALDISDTLLHSFLTLQEDVFPPLILNSYILQSRPVIHSKTTIWTLISTCRQHNVHNTCSSSFVELMLDSKNWGHTSNVKTHVKIVNSADELWTIATLSYAHIPLTLKLRLTSHLPLFI